MDLRRRVRPGSARITTPTWRLFSDADLRAGKTPGPVGGWREHDEQCDLDTRQRDTDSGGDRECGERIRRKADQPVRSVGRFAEIPARPSVVEAPGVGARHRVHPGPGQRCPADVHAPDRRGPASDAPTRCARRRVELSGHHRRPDGTAPVVRPVERRRPGGADGGHSRAARNADRPAPGPRGALCPLQHGRPARVLRRGLAARPKVPAAFIGVPRRDPLAAAGDRPGHGRRADRRRRPGGRRALRGPLLGMGPGAGLRDPR